MLSPPPISNLYQNRNDLTRIKTSPAFAPSSYCIVIVLSLAPHFPPATELLAVGGQSGLQQSQSDFLLVKTEQFGPTWQIEYQSALPVSDFNYIRDYII